MCFKSIIIEYFNFLVFFNQVLWWDMRKLTAPIDTLVLDPSGNPRIECSMAAACLEYDPSMPNKFLVGTHQGNLKLI